MKKLLFSLLLLFPTLLFAQLSVANFYLDESDQTANAHGTLQYDQNGDVCALIRIQTTQKGFAFEVGSLGVTKVDENHVGEVWLYVPHGVKKVTIRHGQLGTLPDYYFPVSIEAARTYVMNLITGTVHTTVEEAVTQQFVAISVTPKTARVTLNGEAMPVDGDGSLFKMMPFGTYDYRVECNMYHPQVGKLVVNDPDNTVNLNVKLKPNFGYIDVSGSQANGGSVYIDNELKGTVPFQSAPIVSGNHNVMVVKNLYKPFEKTVSVTDGEHTQLSPELAPNYAHLTWRVDNGAEIWINNQKSGTGSVSGDYATGTYRVETKKQNHRTATKNYEVRPDMMNQTITLQAPEPIMGTLLVTSKPMGATITIDGQDYGKTPRQINKILIGSHQVTLSLGNYSTETATVTVEEGKTATIEKTLQNSTIVNISCTPTNARLYLDGSYLGQGTGNYSLPYGRHTLKAEADQCQPWEQTIEVLSSTSKYTIQMELFGSKTFTVNGVSFTMVAVQGGTFTMGATSEQGSDAWGDEKPAHRVTLSNFYIGKYEVTQALWQTVMGNNPSDWKGDNLPVETVSWNDCQEFIRKLNAKTGMKFRLPTEAEWEYAARGGNKSRGYKYSGSNDVWTVAWYYDNSGSKTHPVGTKRANELGLYDMSGNVNEWCQDWHGSYVTALQTNPKGPSSGVQHVFRGGNWGSNTRSCRVSNRDLNTPGYRDNGLGLRLVLSESSTFIVE